MFTKQECKKLIAKKLEEKQIITRRELISTGRKHVGNNQRYFASVNATVDTSLRELMSTEAIIKIEKGQYKKFM